MVLRKNIQFSQNSLLVFIHDMDAQNSQRRILKGRSDIFKIAHLRFSFLVYKVDYRIDEKGLLAKSKEE